MGLCQNKTFIIYYNLIIRSFGSFLTSFKKFFSPEVIHISFS
jgi:hypothetical protein